MYKVHWNINWFTWNWLLTYISIEFRQSQTSCRKKNKYCLIYSILNQVIGAHVLLSVVWGPLEGKKGLTQVSTNLSGSCLGKKKTVFQILFVIGAPKRLNTHDLKISALRQECSQSCHNPLHWSWVHPWQTTTI